MSLNWCIWPTDRSAQYQPQGRLLIEQVPTITLLQIIQLNRHRGGKLLQHEAVELDSTSVPALQGVVPLASVHLQTQVLPRWRTQTMKQSHRTKRRKKHKKAIIGIKWHGTQRKGHRFSTKNSAMTTKSLSTSMNKKSVDGSWWTQVPMQTQRNVLEGWQYETLTTGLRKCTWGWRGERGIREEGNLGA